MLSEQIKSQIIKLLNSGGIRAALADIRQIHDNGAVTAYKLTTNQGQFFVKVADKRSAKMLAGEVYGLEKLAGTQCVSTPAVIGYQECSDEQPAILITSWVEGTSGGTETGQKRLGEELAALHDASAEIYHVSQFGLDQDNYIGNNPQYNSWMPSWPDFFIKQRLLPQIKMGVSGKLIDFEFEQKLYRLCDVIRDQLTILHHTPSLLHGDLWGGNVLYDEREQPILIDPAIYFGVPEADLAFTELFGGFSRPFYDAYHSILPISPGYEERKQFYNLYHMLNHMNLFGGMFYGQIKSLCLRYVG